MTNSSLEGSIFGVFEGLGPPWETSWGHCEVSGGHLEVLGSILVPFGSPLDSIWCPWGAI